MPLLPDVLGGLVRVFSARYSLRAAARRWRFRFRQAALEEVDVDARCLRTDQGTIGFDHAILATGAETTYRDRDDLRPRSWTIDSAEEVVSTSRALDDPDLKTVVVSGGGPTGVEVASNIMQRFARRPLRVVLVEFAERLCSRFAAPIPEYVARNIRSMGIEVHTSAVVESIEDRQVTLSDGAGFPSAMVVWCAGVRPGSWTGQWGGDQRAGRVVTDTHLRVGPGVYAAGDVAAFCSDGEPIRMSVQHAIGGGVCAAENVLRDIAGRDPEPFRPVDLGWVVPMANGLSCGTAMGLTVQGRTATMLHYFMSTVRSQSPSTGAAVAWDVFRTRLGRLRYAPD